MPRQAAGGDAAHLQPGGVEVFPHVGGDTPAHRMGIAAGRAQAVIDAGGVLFVEGKEVQHALGIQLRMPLKVIVQGAAAEQRHGQFIQAITAPGLGHQRQGVTDLEHARQVLGAL